MPANHLTQPFPDYVICPQCGEPEVEVWCYELSATCHACGHTFGHSLPGECEGICNDELRARASRSPLRPMNRRCVADFRPLD